MDRDRAQTLLHHMEAVIEQTHKLQMELLATWRMALDVQESMSHRDAGPPQVTLPELHNLPDKTVFSVAEVAEILGLSRNSTYEAIRRAEIPSVKMGRRVLIPREALQRVLSAT